ncbi:MAG: hypothetical protein AAGG38_06260 [Planctomycetota bacterium]
MHDFPTQTEDEWTDEVEFRLTCKPRRVTFVQRFGVEASEVLRDWTRYDAALAPAQRLILRTWAEDPKARPAEIARALSLTPSGLNTQVAPIKKRIAHMGSWTLQSLPQQPALEKIGLQDANETLLGLTRERLTKRQAVWLDAIVDHPDASVSGIADVMECCKRAVFKKIKVLRETVELVKEVV